MKKTIRLIITILSMLLLYSINTYAESTIICPNCGKELPDDVLFCSYCGTAITESDNELKAIVTGSDEKGNLRIDFGEDGIVVCDNDYVTVQLICFYEENQQRIENVSSDDYERNNYVEKYMELKVHNNSEEEYIFDLNDYYVGDDSVVLVMQVGNSGPAPGKNKTYQYRLERKSGNKHVPLEDLRDLYDFECTVDLHIESKEEDIIKDTFSDKIVFSDSLKDVQEVIQETTEDTEGTSMEQLAFESVLVNSKWVNDTGNAYIIFEKDGTGQFCNPIGLVFDLVWELDENTINCDLFNEGVDINRKTSFALQNDNGEFFMYYVNDPSLVLYPTDK